MNRPMRVLLVVFGIMLFAFSECNPILQPVPIPKRPIVIAGDQFFVEESDLETVSSLDLESSMIASRPVDGSPQFWEFYESSESVQPIGVINDSLINQVLGTQTVQVNPSETPIPLTSVAVTMSPSPVATNVKHQALVIGLRQEDAAIVPIGNAAGYLTTIQFDCFYLPSMKFKLYILSFHDDAIGLTECAKYIKTNHPDATVLILSDYPGDWKFARTKGYEFGKRSASGANIQALIFAISK